MENSKTEKSCIDGGGDDNEEEERKVEEFFALIRSFREARNRRRDELREMEEMKKEKKKMKMSVEEKPSWIPAFRREDFMQEIKFPTPPMIFPGPCNGKDKKKQPEDGLDLNLSL
ncbi:hypothetical protein SLEP1_g48197 [Rubroshorea leprosula]|uniref:Uncharacterized protein n=1 Tax=Rubroshorea leprosula TaxID=152421 RepID=A0AAV5LV65_9ROSI|nr:hypothetical protein SLEP1_g48197 [Rubroshorea leprosula]